MKNEWSDLADECESRPDKKRKIADVDRDEESNDTQVSIFHLLFLYP